MIFSRKNSRIKDLASRSGEELVLLYQQTRDKSYFGEIYQRYSHLVYGACLKYLKDRDTARDTMMDIFEKLMKKLPQQNEINSLESWLFQVARNECFNRLRQMKKHSVESLDNDFDKKMSESFVENEDFLSLIDNTDVPSLEDRVNNAMNQLKPEQKACVEAFYLKNKSYKEIEKELGFPLKKVKSYIQNGKRNLKSLLLKTQT